MYLFADPKQISVSPYLNPSLEYFPYSRKDNLLSIIKKIIHYQDENSLVDYHPSYNDLKDDLKKLADERMNN